MSCPRLASATTSKVNDACKLVVKKELKRVNCNARRNELWACWCVAAPLRKEERLIKFYHLFKQLGMCAVATIPIHTEKLLLIYYSKRSRLQGTLEAKRWVRCKCYTSCWCRRTGETTWHLVSWEYIWGRWSSVRETEIWRSTAPSLQDRKLKSWSINPEDHQHNAKNTSDQICLHQILHLDKAASRELLPCQILGLRVWTGSLLPSGKFLQTRNDTELEPSLSWVDLHEEICSRYHKGTYLLPSRCHRPDLSGFAFRTALGQILISCSEVLLLLVDRVVEIFCAVCTGYGDVDQVIRYYVGRRTLRRHNRSLIACWSHWLKKRRRCNLTKLKTNLLLSKRRDPHFM